MCVAAHVSASSSYSAPAFTLVHLLPHHPCCLTIPTRDRLLHPSIPTYHHSHIYYGPPLTPTSNHQFPHSNASSPSPPSLLLSSHNSLSFPTLSVSCPITSGMKGLFTICLQYHINSHFQSSPARTHSLKPCLYNSFTHTSVQNTVKQSWRKGTTLSHPLIHFKPLQVLSPSFIFTSHHSYRNCNAPSSAPFQLVPV